MKRGFAALMTSIIISFVLLGTVLSVNRTAFYFQQSLLYDEYKTQSVAIALSCIDTAVVLLLQDAGYVPMDDEFDLLEGLCRIKEITGESEKLINVQSVFNESYTNLEGFVDMEQLEKGIYSIREF